MQFDKLFTRTDRGVSPVVGVILMVAITVILAAVIGTFVLDLGSNVQQNPQAGVTFSEDGGNVTVQLVSKENAEGVYVQYDGGQFVDSDGNDDTSDLDSATYALENVGDSVTVTPTDSVTVIGELGDKTAVIQTYTFE
jgi:flagellin-like protein